MAGTGGMRTAILATLAADTDIAAATRTIKYHGGKFTEKELARYGAHGPAILLTWMGIGATQFPQETYLQGVWMLFVVTKYRDRHTDAQVIHDDVMRLLAHGERWGGEACQIPEDIRSKNMYSTAYDEAGVVVIMISWKQFYELSEESGAGFLDFETLHTCYWTGGDDPETSGMWGDEWGALWGVSCLAEEIQTLETS